MSKMVNDKIYASIGNLARVLESTLEDIEMIKLELFTIARFIERAAPGALNATRIELQATLCLAQGLHRAYKEEMGESGKTPPGKVIPFGGAKIFV